MDAVPIRAIARVAWTRSVKWRRYQVTTPAIATTNQSPYHAPGYVATVRGDYNVPSRYCWP